MVYTLAVDDMAGAMMSREEARQRMDEHLLDPFSVKPDLGAASVTNITETRQERQERLRKTWGHDPAAQNQWRR